MNYQHGFAFPDHFENDAYSATRMRDRVLNEAIIRADISNSYEEFLRSSTNFTPTMSRPVTKGATSRFVGRRRCDRFS